VNRFNGNVFCVRQKIRSDGEFWLESPILLKKLFQLSSLVLVLGWPWQSCLIHISIGLFYVSFLMIFKLRELLLEFLVWDSGIPYYIYSIRKMNCIVNVLLLS
jgi:hypothetical protein